jgi:hypothetical protein
LWLGDPNRRCKSGDLGLDERLILNSCHFGLRSPFVKRTHDINPLGDNVNTITKTHKLYLMVVEWFAQK